MAERVPHLLVAGVTTRALAVSAARAGYRVTAIDAFGDLDLREAAGVVALTRASGGFTPRAAARAARRIPAGQAVYTSNFENYPDAVALLARGRELLGNPPAVLRRVRDPYELMRALRRRGLPAPLARATAPAPAPRRAWLLKPRRSGGGHGVRAWRGGRTVPRRAYLQERIAGPAGSVIFLADGHGVHLLGVTRQLVGLPQFGARGFRYCGSLLGSARAPLFDRMAQLTAAAGALAQAVTEEFGLVGLNGIDFIARGGVPYPIEVNPRICASMELVERSGGTPLFELHRRACRGELPRPAEVGVPRGVLGKAVVFARRAVRVGRIRRRADIADVPHPEERIARGHPICTVFAGGPEAEACLRALAARAGDVYGAMEPGVRGAA